MNLIKFNKTTGDESIGGKAGRLAEMYRAEFPVPNGFVILPEAFDLYLKQNKAVADIIHQAEVIDHEIFQIALGKVLQDAVFPESILKELTEMLNHNDFSGINSWAVRSSASLEDGVSNSFAGQFESILHVKSPENIKNAIIRCWSSMYGIKVLSYCKSRGIPMEKLHLTVILQEQIDSDISGVVFTANPMTGNDTQMVVEAVLGQGEGLVQGTVTPDRYLYDWYREEISEISTGNQEQKLTTSKNQGLVWQNVQQSGQIVNTDKIRTLCTLCLRIQEFYGEPTDIEWAIANDKIHILQARPITKINYEVDSSWTTADLKDGGVSSGVAAPMLISMYEMIFDYTMGKYLKSIRVLPPDYYTKWFRSWFGISYWNLEAAKQGGLRIPGFNERNFDRSMGIEPDYEGDGRVTGFTLKTIFQGLQILRATNKSIRNRVSVCKSVIAEMEKNFEACEAMLKSTPDPVTLINYFESLIVDQYLVMEGKYFMTIYDNSNATTFCQEAVDKANKKNREKIRYLNLVVGLKNLSHLRPALEIWDLVATIRENKLQREYFEKKTVEELVILYQQNDTAFPQKPTFDALLRKYCYHSMRELDLMVPNWDEDPTQVFSMVKTYLENKEFNPHLLEEKQKRIYEANIRKVKSSSLLKKINTHRELLWWREEMRDYSSKMYHYVRKVLLKIGDMMVEKSMINDRDDVFFLTYLELVAFNHIGTESRYKNKIQKNKIFYRSFRNYKFPNEIRKQKATTNGNHKTEKLKDSFKGIVGSEGTVTGRAVVIKTVFEAGQIQQGDILITKSTDPAWTIYFARIAGLVTESGGILSHGAVVSREYGIPAIMGVNGITDMVRTGDMVEIDGINGLVKIHHDD